RRGVPRTSNRACRDAGAVECGVAAGGGGAAADDGRALPTLHAARGHSIAVPLHSSGALVNSSEGAQAVNDALHVLSPVTHHSSAGAHHLIAALLRPGPARGCIRSALV